MRDHEYKRHGTLTLMAGIDLLTGHIHALVKERHRSREFIEWIAGRTDRLAGVFLRDFGIFLRRGTDSSQLAARAKGIRTPGPTRMRYVRKRRPLCRSPNVPVCDRDRDLESRFLQR
jgi:hypothetical protein